MNLDCECFPPPSLLLVIVSASQSMWESSDVSAVTVGSQGRRVVVNRVRPMWANQGEGTPPPRPPRTPSFEDPPLRPQMEPYDIFCKVSQVFCIYSNSNLCIRNKPHMYLYIYMYYTSNNYFILRISFKIF